MPVDPGFQPENAILFDLYLPSSRYPDATQQRRFYRELMRSLSETPGVQSAGGLLYFVFRPKLWLTNVWVEDAPVAAGEEPIAYYNLASGDYFQAMGIPLKAGRWPTAREMWEEDRVVVVNETFARQILPGKNPLGRRIRNGVNGPVGVRSMVMHDALRLALAGALTGLVAAALAGRLMQGLLFGIGSLDPLTYAVVSCALTIVLIVASWLPARRASRIDAMTALRGE